MYLYVWQQNVSGNIPINNAYIIKMFCVSQSANQCYFMLVKVGKSIQFNLFKLAMIVQNENLETVTYVSF